MKTLSILKVLFLFVLTEGLWAQNKYWVSQNDERSVRLINQLNLEPRFCSDWLQSCTYELSEFQYQWLSSHGIDIHKNLEFEPKSKYSTQNEFGFALEQIHAEVMTKNGLTGRGVKIGIIDGGFLKANEDVTLQTHFGENRVVYYRDFVTPDLDKYAGSIGLDDGHGTEVWQLIGGLDPSKQVQYGLATEATYYLARTDHGGFEKRIEEDFVVHALEEMYQQGVRLVNLSLGYTDGFNSPDENYSVSEVDGKTSMLTKAIDHAAKNLGMLIVIAAGNDGARQWQTLSIPADAEHALTVGSSKLKIFDKMNFSSIGPEGLPYVKPDVSVYSTLGTSFSAPVITGLAACIWEYDSTLSYQEVIQLLQKSSNFYPYPNNYLGYGVPDCRLIFQYLKVPETEVKKVKAITTSRKKVAIKRKTDNNLIVAYHKKDERNVMFKSISRTDKATIKIKRPDACVQSTLLIDNRTIEIIWR